jgi:exodeoxyribonuclease VII large subunit
LLRAEIIRITQRRETVLRVAERLQPAFDGQLARKRARYIASAQLFDSLNYKSVLARGFALVRDGEGTVLRSAAAISDGQKLVLEFVDGTADATGGRNARPKTAGKTKPNPTEQGALF